MKPFPWKGLAAFAALLLVPLLAVTVMAAPPTANDDAGAVNEDDPAGVAIDVLANDVDGGDGIDATSVTQGATAPSDGSIAIDPITGVITYTPTTADFYGTDVFTYTVNDDLGNPSNEATVTVTVNPVNDDPPVAEDDAVSTPNNKIFEIDILANDTDADEPGFDIDSTTVTIVVNGSHGTATVDPVTGIVTYDPVILDPGYLGDDTFTYTVDDKTTANTSNIATVTVTQTFPPPQAWGDQLKANYITHPYTRNNCDSVGVDSALGKWHFDAYPRGGTYPVLTFGIRNTGVLDNLTDVTLTSLIDATVDDAVDSLFIYKDDGDSLFSWADDEPIDSLEFGTFNWTETVTFTGMRAELPANDTTFFHILIHIDSLEVRYNPDAYADSGIGLFIAADGGLETELETGGPSSEVKNPCFDPYWALVVPAPEEVRAAAFNVMMRVPSWGATEELYTWFISDSLLTGNPEPPGNCNQEARDSAYGKWHFDAFARDDKVPVLTFAMRNLGPSDTLQRIAFTSEMEMASSISKLWLYSDGDGDSVYTDGAEDMLYMKVNPGNFAAGDMFSIGPLNYVLGTDDTTYFHIVVEMNTAAIEANPLGFDHKGVGVAIKGDSTFVMSPSSYSMYGADGYGVHAAPGVDDDAVLNDPTQAWGALVGFTITNLDDGSSGPITANTGTTITATLAGGTEDLWDLDDHYEITLPMADGASTVENPCYAGNLASTNPWEYGAVIGVPNWGVDEELWAWYVSDSLLTGNPTPPGSCTQEAVDSAYDWHFEVGPYGSAAALTFAIRNTGPADTLTSVTVTSQNGMSNTIDRLALYMDEGDSTFGVGDTKLAEVAITDPWAWDDPDSVARFNGFREELPGHDTTYYHVVAWMNTAAIIGSESKATYQSYDTTGVGVKIAVDSIQLVFVTGQSNDVANPCPDKFASHNVIFQALDWDDGVDPEDDLFATYRASDSTIRRPDATGDYDDMIEVFRFFIEHRTGFLDDTLKSLTLTSRATVPKMVQRLWLYRDMNGNKRYTAGVDSLVGSMTITSDFADGDTVTFTGLHEVIPGPDSTYFFVLVDLNEEEINDSPLAFMCAKLNVEIAAGDIGMKWADGTSHLVQRPSGYALTVNSLPILMSPADLTFELFFDADGNGGANIGDSIRIYADLSANSPVIVDIAEVWTDLSWWYASLNHVVLEDAAGDYHFEARVLLDSTGGLLDVIPPDDTLDITVYARGTVHECNEVSEDVSFATVDFVDIIAPTTWGDRTFTKLADVDGNGCLGLGDSIKIEVAFGVVALNGDTVGTVDELDSVFANILDAGLGGPEGTFFDRVPLTRDSTRLDTVDPEADPEDLYVTDSAWFSLVWELKEYPQDSAVDTFGNVVTVTIFGKDNAGNYDTTQTNAIVEPVDTRIPEAISGLTAESLPNAGVRLCWTTYAADAEYFLIYHDSAGVRGGFPDSMYSIDSAVINGSLINPGGSPVCWTSDLTTGLEDGKLYKFIVRTMDDCGNMEFNTFVVAAFTDATPAQSCVFQPDTGGVYSPAIPLTVYVRPAVDPDDNDLAAVKARGRLADRGDGQPGPWTDLSGWITQTLSGEDIAFAIPLDTAALNALVGTATAKIELVILTQDEVGNLNTDAEALAACDPVFWFYWSHVSLVCEIQTINGNLPLYQPYCNDIGFEVYGDSNTVALHVEGGAEPYKVAAWVQAPSPPMAKRAVVDTNWTLIFYAEDQLADVSFNLDASDFEKGAWDLRVWFKDASHAVDFCYAMLCVPDTIAPCAIISKPVDGKCIRRSLSQNDPVEICATVDPLGNCIDPENVLKIDFQWATLCCDDYAGIECRDTSWFELEPGADTGSAVCDTFPSGTEGFEIDSIVCVFDTTGGYTLVRRDSTICDTVECTDLWYSIGIVPGGGAYCIDWWNTEDLAWITASGTNIYLRAQIYDDQGNMFTTECVQVCVDIDTPPMCISSPDVCVAGDGIVSLGGDGNTIVAELEWADAGYTYDDIEKVFLYWKKSTAPDVYSSWLYYEMEPATNSTMWRYDGFSTASLDDQVYYDFRVITKTIWGTWSYDMDGDGQFDAGTFDTTNCDAVTWFIDNNAANIWIDTVWTEIDGHELVQPNVSCELSDPRGWAWAQYGQDITVQPLVEPFADTSDIVKVVWTLWDGDECAACDCEEGFDEGEGCDSKVLAIHEGDNALDPLTFNPTVAPFVEVQDGFQMHVLHVKAYDACGNWTEDCIELYLLDIDVTEAIIIDPENGDVFCQSDTEGGGIVITAAALLGEVFEKAVFYYRAAGAETWIPFDSADGLSGMWYPHALGLTDGAYELTVAVEDHAGNRSEAGVYTTTVHLSCAEPTVTLTYPTAEMFIGCEIELTALVEDLDFYNYVTVMTFYYAKVTDDPSGGTPIGTDLHAVNDVYSYLWTPDIAVEGPYYFWAEATLKSGSTVRSELVWVYVDNTAPTTVVTAINGSQDLTGILIDRGTDVAILARAWDNTNGSGLDTVKIYVAYNGEPWTFSKLFIAPSDTLFEGTWPTAGLPLGDYTVYVWAMDKTCNESSYSVDVTLIDHTPPVAWIAGFGDGTVVCPFCELYRIYAITCDYDVVNMHIQMRQAGGDWLTVGTSTRGSAPDTMVWYTDWKSCDVSGSYEFRAVPETDNYDAGTEEHYLYDIDPDIQPILDVTISAQAPDFTECVLSYSGGDVSSIEFEDNCVGNLSNTRVTTASSIEVLKMLALYQPLNVQELYTEEVELVPQQGAPLIYHGHFDDNAILNGGEGMFFTSYYSGMVSYLRMADFTVFRVYPELGLPGEIANVTTGATLKIEPGAVDATNGVFILPSPQKPRTWDERYLMIWGYEPDWVTTVRFTNPLGEGLNIPAKVKISYDENAPTDLSKLFIGYNDGSGWVYTDGEIYIGPDAAGWDTENHTVEFHTWNLHCQFAVLSKADPCNCFSISVQQHHIEPWSNDYTSLCPSIWTKIQSNTGANIDSGLITVWLDDDVIYNSDGVADGWIATWDPVSDLFMMRSDCSSMVYGGGGLAKVTSITEGTHTITVRAENTQGACCEKAYEFKVDGTPPRVFMDDDSVYVSIDPTLTFYVVDDGAGVNWDSVYVDLYDITASVGCDTCYDGKFTPVRDWFYTETPSGFLWADDTTLYFQYTPHEQCNRRILAVIYDGYRERHWGDYWEYPVEQFLYPLDHGVPDLVWNRATPLFRVFTIACDTTVDLPEAAFNEPNPFDPLADEYTTIHLGGDKNAVFSVTIYDLAGEKVVTLVENTPVELCGQGDGTLRWYGRTGDGQYVADGVYLCHISGKSIGLTFSHVLKIAVVKGD